MNGYVQALVWRGQLCGDLFWEVLRVARAFRQLPPKQKQIVFNYGLRDPKGEKGDRKSRKRITEMPPVQYTKWVLNDPGADDDAEGE